MEKRFKVAKIRVFHQDCFASESTAKFPEVELLQRSNQVVHKRDARSVVYTVIWEVRAPSKKELEDYLDYLASYPGVLEARVLSRTGKSAMVLVRVKSATASYDTMLKQGAYYLSPVSVAAGLEQHAIVVVEPKKLGRILEECAGLGEVKLESVVGTTSGRRGVGKPGAGIEGVLTPKQQDALAKALKHGYYDWPKKITLEELAELDGLPRRTFHERLRRAESKLLPKLLRDALF